MRTRSSVCMTSCDSSTSRRRTSRIEPRTFNFGLHVATSLRISQERIGSFSPTGSGVCGGRSSTGAQRSSCCTASPHPWNVLNTKKGPLFVDFENCVSGPVEFDLGWVPKAVSECYPGVDQDLVGECRGL